MTDRPTTETPTTDRPATNAAALALHNLVKRFADVVAVDDVSLDVATGEFVTLLGPSGSGKTTTLRLIAGFTAPDGGSIEIDGRNVERMPPYRRDVGMVFQNYALFPHMTAAQNIAFPLEMRRVGRNDIKKAVADALSLVKLDGMGGRYPRQLSGGQQQRIALARAVVFRPRLLLMDEPLGALDKKLRESLQLEILRISRQLGATVIYVTHDQEEALVMSDRIAIFNQGRIEQLGTGGDLYERPTSLFVADFIGESNILRGQIERDGEAAWLRRKGWRWRIAEGAVERAGLTEAATAALVIRPERLEIRSPDRGTEGGDGRPPGVNLVEAAVTEVLYLGPSRKYALTLPDGQPAVVRQPASAPGDSRVGDRVVLAWAPDDAVLVRDAG
jgi:putative spermidine/putrescine transport system ATP-binding protein